MSLRGRYHELRSQLQATVDRLGSISEDALETRSEYVRYLIVRLSGFVEYTLEQLAVELIHGQGYGVVRSFASSFAGYLGNPNADNICNFVRRFDSTWANDLETFLRSEERRTSLNSLVGLRHVVAHGKPSSIGVGMLQGYLQVVDDLFAWILDRFEPLQP